MEEEREGCAGLALVRSGRSRATEINAKERYELCTMEFTTGPGS
jgi:hypothetical protein